MRILRWTTPLVIAAVVSFSPACVQDEGGTSTTTMLSSNGVFEGTFTPTPDPPRTGGTVYEAKLVDAQTGAAIEGATLVVTPWMPAHGHGTKQPPEIEELGGGVYEITVFYTMAGVWETTVEVRAGAIEDRFLVTREVVQ